MSTFREKTSFVGLFFFFFWYHFISNDEINLKIKMIALVERQNEIFALAFALVRINLTSLKFSQLKLIKYIWREMI